jgi:hypothetical protein
MILLLSDEPAKSPGSRSLLQNMIYMEGMILWHYPQGKPTESRADRWKTPEQSYLIF